MEKFSDFHLDNYCADHKSCRVPQLSDLIGTGEVAQLLSIERSTVSRWVKEGRMPGPALRVGGSKRAAWVFERSTIEQFRDDLIALAGEPTAASA